jgi:predicted nucleotide-binding protein
VVYGRDEKVRGTLFGFLRAVGLRPLEWSQVIDATGEGSPYVGTVLSKGFSIAQAAIILLTPDDEARLREHLRSDHDEPFEAELRPQPRPNVLFEAGMALGKYEERTILVEVGRLRPFSDVLGRHTIRLDNSVERRKELAQRLERAGCAVDTSGNDWLKPVDFSPTNANP